MTNPNDPKVVPGGDVQFDSGSVPRADTLDGVVQQASGSAGSESWELENMQALALRLRPTLENTRTAYNNNTKEFYGSSNQTWDDYLSELAVYLFTLRKAANITKCGAAKIGFCDIHPPQFRQFLEARHGSAIVRSGIYQATGLDRDEPVRADKIFPYFPEMEKLLPLAGRYVELTRNSYQRILTFPSPARAFFTGAVSELPELIDERVKEMDFHWPLTFREILQYAEKINQVEKVADYMKLIKGE